MASTKDPKVSDWTQKLSGIAKLKGPERVPPTRPPPSTLRQAAPPPQSFRRNPSDFAVLTVEDDGETVSAFRDGGDRQHARKLARGEIRPEFRLDLHGMTQKQAERALENAFQDAELRNFRCFLVVCGRGLHSGEAGPVLRTTTIWALSSIYADRVIAFASAPKTMGGAGAILVWLKRAR